MPGTTITSKIILKKENAFAAVKSAPITPKHTVAVRRHLSSDIVCKMLILAK
jgi:hypothetical protein